MPLATSASDQADLKKTLSGKTFKEVDELLNAKRKEGAELFSKGYQNFSEDEVKQAQHINAECAVIQEVWEGKRDLDGASQQFKAWEKAANTPATEMRHGGKSAEELLELEEKSAERNREGGRRYSKSLSELFVESEGYQKREKSQPRIVFTVEGFDPQELGIKATLTTTAGFAPEIRRSGRVLDSAQRRPVVADLIPQDTTSDSAVRYMEETTFTNAAAPVAENAAKPESALQWTERTIPVEVIATWIPITQQQLDDVNGIQGLVNNRLTLMLLLTEENQLLNGSGVSPNLLGFYNKPGIQTQAKGADPVPDAFYKGFQKVRTTGFADPTGIVMHPDDWTDVRLLRTADGLYIWGNPSEPGPERMWGVPVIQTVAATSGTGLTGDFQLYSHISRRMGIRIDVTDSHADFFQYNKLAIRIEERLSLEIYRATAFCLVTGI